MSDHLPMSPADYLARIAKPPALLVVGASQAIGRHLRAAFARVAPVVVDGLEATVWSLGSPPVRACVAVVGGVAVYLWPSSPVGWALVVGWLLGLVAGTRIATETYERGGNLP